VYSKFPQRRATSPAQGWSDEGSRNASASRAFGAPMLRAALYSVLLAGLSVGWLAMAGAGCVFRLDRSLALFGFLCGMLEEIGRGPGRRFVGIEDSTTTEEFSASLPKLSLAKGASSMAGDATSKKPMRVLPGSRNRTLGEQRSLEANASGLRCFGHLGPALLTSQGLLCRGAAEGSSRPDVRASRKSDDDASFFATRVNERVRIDDAVERKDPVNRRLEFACLGQLGE
jgi:hypothetical protein